MHQFEHATPPPASEAYETDFALWVERQSTLLRARQFELLDLENLIEEVKSMGISQRLELSHRLETLLVHLLKCQFQPEQKSGSWLGTLHEQRFRLERLLRHSPSLHHSVMQYADDAYPAARAHAVAETDLPSSTFPTANSYSKDQLFDSGFVP